MPFFHLKSSFRWRHCNFCTFIFIYFSMSALLCFKINLEVYIINCLIKNLITDFVWYLEKKQWHWLGMSLTLCRYLWNIFMKRSYRKCAPKAKSRLLNTYFLKNLSFWVSTKFFQELALNLLVKFVKDS